MGCLNVLDFSKGFILEGDPSSMVAAFIEALITLLLPATQPPQ